jgi:predicted O-methyltransferase YrrM
MIYELEITWRTIRREGFGSLFNKISIYLRQLAKGMVFMLRPLPVNLPPAQMVDFDLTAGDNFLQTCQVRSEILELTSLFAERRPKTVVEIGTAHGGTLFLWCRLAPPDATIVSLDLPGGIHGGGYPYWKSFIYRRFPIGSQRLHLLRGDSHKPEMFARLKSILPGDGKVDFLFIDGDHTYEGVKQDFEMYSGLVRPGGLIVFHDICKHPDRVKCDVDRFWQEVKNERRAREFVHDINQGTCGIGVIEV